MQRVEVFIVIDMLVDSFRHPDVNRVVGLELEAVSVQNILVLAWLQHRVQLVRLERLRPC